MSALAGPRDSSLARCSSRPATQKRQRHSGLLLIALALAGCLLLSWEPLQFTTTAAAGRGDDKLRRGPLAAKALAPTLPVAPLADEWGGDREHDGHEVSQEDIARLRLARGSNLYALTTEADLEQLLKLMAEAGRLLVVDYYAPWCRACQRLLRQMQNLAMEDQFRNVAFASVDFEQSRDLCTSRNVEKLPTLEIYKGDELRQRWAGASKKRLLERLGNEMAAEEKAAPELVSSAAGSSAWSADGAAPAARAAAGGGAIRQGPATARLRRESARHRV